MSQTIRGLRILRLVTRLAMLAVMALTAAVAASFAGWVPNPINTAAPDSPLAAFGEIIAGGPVSLSILEFEILDPTLGLLALVADPGSTVAILTAMAIPLVVAVLFGRVFCAYVCPVGWLATAMARVRARLERHLRLPKLRGSNAGRWLLGLVLLAGLAGLSSSASLVLLHLHPQRWTSAPFDQGLLFFALGATVLFCATEILLAPGLWCSALCPTGVIYDLVARRRVVTLEKTGQQACPKGCHLCDEVCWLHLEPRSGRVGPSCDLCLTCAVACPKKRLEPGRARGIITTTVVILLMSAPSLGRAEPGPLPRLEDKPLWSFEINQLDHEVWNRDGGREVGLGVSFVDHTADGDLYLIGAALWDPTARPPATAAHFSLTGENGDATLHLEKPNAPRSTPKREIYEARALVAPGSCQTLKVSFETLEVAAELRFPHSCRHRRPTQALAGALGLAILLGLGVLITRLGRARSPS